MGELSSSEKLDTVKPKIEDFKNIKPDDSLSVSETKEFWDEEFKNIGKELNTDSKGVEYRQGDELIPNTCYEVNGYKYKTDDNGRIISAEGILQIKDHEDRYEMDPRSSLDKGDMRDTDDRGHLIADRFNGSGGIENLVPMDSELNRYGDYNTLENTLADAVNDGAKVYFKVEPIYQEDSNRPSQFKVTYSIDGDKNVRVFKNGE